MRAKRRSLYFDERMTFVRKSRDSTMGKFFSEFKKFITRGNVVDMAVGVIVGSSFTAIVNGLSNFILKPLINWLLALLLGKDTLSEVFTFLVRVDKEELDEAGNATGNMIADLEQSIYIDWGAFINAVINFFIVAFVLFVIVRIFNRLREGQKELIENLDEGNPTHEERKEMRKLGIRFSDKAAVAAYYAEKAKKQEEEKLAAEEAARQERLANPTTEDLLKEIRDLLQKNN